MGDSKPQMLENLRRLVRDALQMRRAGASQVRLVRAGGAIDGYSRALLDSGIASRSELLALIAAERTRLDGPATGSPRSELDPIAAA